MADDYYAVLGLTREATEQDVKKAFRKIARECHPDVVGDDPAKLARFKSAKDAYEVLGDSTARVKYDRRLDRKGQRMRTGGSFRDAFYRRSSDAPSSGRSGPQQRSSRRVNDPKNNIGLDDLFNDFGFGDSRTSSNGRTRTGGTRSGTEKTRPPPRESPFQQSDVRARAGRERTARPPMPQPGSDVHIDLDVPARVARDGGMVDAVYRRMERADSWRPGAPDAGILQIRDLTVVRLLPGTKHGEVLHEKGKGDAGAYGGPYGDLIARVRVVGAQPTDARTDAREAPAPDVAAESPKADSGKSNLEDGVVAELTVDVDMVVATLGGQVEVITPQGRVRLTVPPGTSSDKKLRLRGKGASKVDGSPSDLTVRLRVVVPKDLSEESAALLRQFAMSRFPTEPSPGDA